MMIGVYEVREGDVVVFPHSAVRWQVLSAHLKVNDILFQVRKFGHARGKRYPFAYPRETDVELVCNVRQTTKYLIQSLRDDESWGWHVGPFDELDYVRDRLKRARAEHRDIRFRILEATEVVINKVLEDE